MRPIHSKHASFTLYRHPSAGGLVWYARFWNPDTRRYAVTRSTGVLVEGKHERRAEALAAAREMLPGIHFTPDPADVGFLDYLREFWEPTTGVYVRDCVVMKKCRPSAYYVEASFQDIRRHLVPFPPFKNLTLRNLTPGLIFDWIAWATDQGVGARRINADLQLARVAVRHAVRRGDLFRDPFAGIGSVPEEHREKGVLSVAEVRALVAVNYPDPRMKMALLLACLCGMRRGEIRGLLWGDVDEVSGLIHIVHNLVVGEPDLKTPKRGSARTVPLPDEIRPLLAILHSFYGEDSHEFVLGGSKAIVASTIDHNFPKVMEAIGIDEAHVKARNITLHGLRHTFVTLSRLAGISDFEVQALAGHKSVAMMEHYSHAAQVIDFIATKAKFEKAMGE